MYLMRRQARALELIPGGFPPVELPVAVALAVAEPARELIAGKPCSREPFAHVRPHLVRRRGNAGAYGSYEIGRSGVELVRERIDGGGGYARREAPPAGMRRRDRSAFRIGDEERHAVGGLNHQRDRGIIGNDNVGVAACSRRARISSPANHDGRSVDLVDPNQMSQIDAERRRDGRPLLVGAGSGTKSPRARRKEVVGQRPQRPADQGRTACRLHPYEAVARLWSHHQY